MIVWGFACVCVCVCERVCMCVHITCAQPKRETCAMHEPQFISLVDDDEEMLIVSGSASHLRRVHRVWKSVEGWDDGGHCWRVVWEVVAMC